jgi:hypothetical protein
MGFGPNDANTIVVTIHLIFLFGRLRLRIILLTLTRFTPV